MKILITPFILFLFIQNAFAQWIPSGTNIYNNNTGNVGINVTTPQSRFHVNGSFIVSVNTANLDPGGSLGTLPNALAQTGWMLIGWNRNAGKGETDFISNQGAGESGGFAFFNHNNSNVETHQVTFYGNGNVGIGVPVPTIKLDVNGTIHSKSVVVDLNNWPDYVFEKDYKLPLLSNVKAYIDQNHHLPDMPSAADVAKDGLNLGEANKQLTRKVEELTLYLIEKDWQLAEQKRVSQSVQEQLSALVKGV